VTNNVFVILILDQILIHNQVSDCLVDCFPKWGIFMAFIGVRLSSGNPLQSRAALFDSWHGGNLRRFFCPIGEIRALRSKPCREDLSKRFTDFDAYGSRNERVQNVRSSGDYSN
jgi:hypothetical protein